MPLLLLGDFCWLVTWLTANLQTAREVEGIQDLAALALRLLAVKTRFNTVYACSFTSLRPDCPSSGMTSEHSAQSLCMVSSKSSACQGSLAVLSEPYSIFVPLSVVQALLRS